MMDQKELKGSHIMVRVDTDWKVRENSTFSGVVRESRGKSGKSKNFGRKVGESQGIIFSCYIKFHNYPFSAAWIFPFPLFPE